MKIQVCRDPVTKMFLGRFGYKIVLIWFIFPILLILTSVYYDTLTSISLSELPAKDADTLPLFKDLTFYSLLIVVPGVFILLNYFLRSVPDMFVTLWENKVVQSRLKSGTLIEEYIAWLKEMETRINRKRDFYIISASMPIIIILSLYAYYRTLTIESPIITSYDIRFFPLSGVVFYAITIFLVYLIVPAVYKGFLIILIPRKLRKKFNVRVKPMHPDKCGGLKSLGDLCIRFDYIFLVGVAGSVLNLFFSEGTEFEIYFATFLIYGFFVTFLFLYPLWPVHTMMKTQKYDLLTVLNEKLDPIYQEIAGKADISAEIEEIQKMDVIYGRVSRMPVWPFDTGGLIRLLTTVFFPFLGLIVDMLITGATS